MQIASEAVKASVAAPLPMLAAVVVTASMCLSIVLTDGRTEGAQRDVLRRIDEAGTTAVIVRAEPRAGLTPAILDPLSNVSGVGWAVAAGSAVDVRNSAIKGGQRVPMRELWTVDAAAIGIPADWDMAPVPSAWASAAALGRLGLPDGYGGVRSDGGASVAVVGDFTPPRQLTFLEPLLVTPEASRGEASSAPSPVVVLVVNAVSPAMLKAVERTVRSLLQSFDPTLIEVSTSGETAKLRNQVSTSLDRSGKSLVTAILALSALLLALVWLAVVMLKRRDFGRRRALGASQRLIVSIILFQVLLLNTVGAVLGLGAATVSLVVSGDPLPSFEYLVAVAVLAMVTGLVAASLPAWLAACRDPLKELRVP